MPKQGISGANVASSLQFGAERRARTKTVGNMPNMGLYENYFLCIFVYLEID